MTTGSGIDSLPRTLVEPLVRAALAEDLGRGGDITTDSTIPREARATARIGAREAGRIAGVDVARLAFQIVDPEIQFTAVVADGQDVAAGGTIATVSGPARGLLTAERVALNFLGHLSGVATQTALIARSIEGTRAHVCCTRKTTPGLRALEKFAVRAGGGMNHRYGLDDAVLIKDNHIAVAGSIGDAVARARTRAGHMVKIEVEVDTLEQLDEALAAKVDVILLDNMAPSTLEKAVRRIDGQAIAEASGGITPDTAPAIAASGVDLISVGWITHSAPCLDVGLDIEDLTA